MGVKEYPLYEGLIGVAIAVVFWGIFMLFVKTDAVRKANADPLVVQVC